MDSDVHRLYGELLNSAHYEFTLACLPHFAAALVAGVVAILIVRWERASRASQFFASFCLVFLLWSVGRGLSLLLTNPEMVLFLSRRLYVLVMLILPLLFQFTQLMVRAESSRMNLIRVVWGISILFALASFLSPSMIYGVKLFAWGYEPQFGVMGVVSLVWIAGLIGLTGVQVFQAWRATRPESIERQRLAWYSFAITVLYFSAIEFLPGLGIELFPMASGPFIGFTVATAYLTFHFGFAEVAPEMAVRGIAERIRGAMLMMDAEGVVQFANQHCELMFGVKQSRLLGRPARTLLGENFEVGRLSAMATSDNSDLEKEWTHVHMRTGQPLDLAMSAFAVLDAHEREVAYVCMLRDLTEQKRMESDRDSSSLKDALTALPNRALFLSELDGALRKQRAGEGPEFCVYFIGLQRMRVINEDLGYSTGDQVLVETARRLQPLLDSADEIARVGGDEFAILRVGPVEPDEARVFAETLLDAIRLPRENGDVSLHVDACIGITTSLRSYGAGADLLRDASIAMYRAKEHANAIEFIGVSGIAGRRTQMEAELRKGLQSDQLRVYYQPIVDIGQGRVAGFEALVRWQHPDRGLIMPDAFLPLAEDVGLMQEVDAFVFRTACADLAAFQRHTNDVSLSVSVNMSEPFLRQAGLPGLIADEVRKHGLDPVDVRLELLERVAQLDPLQTTLRALRARGVGLYVDDFGTGYSALSRLHEAPVTGLKIDRAFVRTLPMGGGGEKIVGTILALANNLGMDAIAEGVTTREELRRLRVAGCTHAQGFYFAKGLLFEDALSWTLDRRWLKRRLGAA